MSFKSVIFNTSFIDDKEKMLDFFTLTKEEFLEFYSYITEEEYEATRTNLISIFT